MIQNHDCRSQHYALDVLRESGPWELYDMRTDRCEQKDLAATDPERLRRLAAVWNQQDSLYVKQRESAPASTKPLMPARA